MLDWPFLIKKIVAEWSMPLPLFFVLFGFAVLLFWRRKQRLAKLVGACSFLFLYLISIQVTGDFFASKLENQYAQYQKAPLNSKTAEQHHHDIDYVLVLGSAHVSDNSQPISSLLSATGLTRLVEGLRVYRLNPGSKLLLSGYRFHDEISHAHALQKVALHFGVPAQDIILGDHLKDTQEEATHWVSLAKGKSLAVVTSASHMPRSMFLFKKVLKQNNISVNLVPAPTDYISHQTSSLTWRSWFPSGRNMRRVERVWHEYLGLLWASIVAKA